MNLNNNLLIILLIFSNITLVGSFQSNGKTIYEEDVLFKTSDGITLKGLLSVPEDIKKPHRLIILITPPQKADRDYFGLYKFIADSLTKKGVAVFRFDNRSFVNRLEKGKVSLLDHASDVHDAFVFLQKDPRFEKTSVGLLGHSEGGCSAVVETARNKKIDFLILLSTTGLPGKELFLHQLEHNMKRAEDLSRSKRTDSAAKAALLQRTRRRAEIVSLNIAPDSMRRLIKTADDRLPLTTKEQFSFEDDSIKWLNNRMITLANFNPKNYYSKITCPVLLLFGDCDEILGHEVQIQGIEAIFKSIGKTNYKINILKNVNHSYEQLNSPKEQPPGFVSVHKQKGYKPKFTKALTPSISQWLSNLN